MFPALKEFYWGVFLFIYFCVLFVFISHPFRCWWSLKLGLQLLWFTGVPTQVPVAICYRLGLLMSEWMGPFGECVLLWVFKRPSKFVLHLQKILALSYYVAEHQFTGICVCEVNLFRNRNLFLIVHMSKGLNYCINMKIVAQLLN